MILRDLSTKSLKFIGIDKKWTLFLDRDGVINKRIVDDYIKKWEQFEFLPDVFTALRHFSDIFGKIFIVSNQQGIGKGLMTEKDLMEIHNKMLEQIKNNGARIDKIYFCPFKKEANSIFRKPNIGMALQAKKDFPQINFEKSIIVGDSVTDMQFGKNMKMVNVFISSDVGTIRKNQQIIDFVFKDLYEFSQNI